MRKPRVESIDQIVAREEETRRAHEAKEVQRRIDLSRQLGDRAMEGEPFGINGFMAIGFPSLNPESAEYQEIVNACRTVRHINSGEVLQVGTSGQMGQVGIKAKAGDKGLAFSVQPTTEGYSATAEVLCSSALYMHTRSNAATLHGSEEEPYGLTFIDSSFIRYNVKPVRVITNLDGHDQYGDGTRAYTDDYTARLMEAVLQPIN